MSGKEEKKITSEEAKKAIAKTYGTTEMKEITAKLEKILVQPIANPKDTLSSRDKPKLMTKTVLDEILGHGGIAAGKLIEIYGEYGTGKTCVAKTLAAEASQEGTVIYIDAEYTFSSERMEEILTTRKLNLEKFWKNIIVLQPKDWLEQLACIQGIPSTMDLDKEGKPPLKLVIVDSLLSLIDTSEDFEGRQNLPLRSRVIRTQMLGKLRQIALSRECAVVFTNQIQEVPDVKPFTPFYLRQKQKGGPTVSHVPDIILFLRKSASDTRVARLMDSSELPVGERVYIINERGIDDVKDDIKQKIERASKKEVEKEVIEVGKQEETAQEEAQQVA